jgi:hypothetical protein
VGYVVLAQGIRRAWYIYWIAFKRKPMNYETPEVAQPSVMPRVLKKVRPKIFISKACYLMVAVIVWLVWAEKYPKAPFLKLEAGLAGAVGGPPFPDI